MARTLGYDRRGVTHMAMSAIDIAAWDAAARSANVPLATLLGGAVRDSVLAYVSGPFLKPGADPYRDFEADIESYVDAGFRAMKLRMGVAPKKDARLLAKVRERVGADFPLMVDLNEGANYRSALEYGEAFRDADLVWMEEPIGHDNLQGYARLAQGAADGLAGGEALIGIAPFREYLSAGALDIVQPDLALCGGFSEALKIAALADAYEVPLIPHVWGTGINFCAALQFVSTLPNTRARRSAIRSSSTTVRTTRCATSSGSFPLGGDGTIVAAVGPWPGHRHRFEPVLLARRRSMVDRVRRTLLAYADHETRKRRKAVTSLNQPEGGLWCNEKRSR